MERDDLAERLDDTNTMLNDLGESIESLEGQLADLTAAIEAATRVAIARG